MAILNICPPKIDLCIKRGDTTVWGFRVLQPDGVTPENITGRTYLLTVNLLEEPVPSDPFLFQLVGTVPLGTDGIILFSLTDAQADNVGDFFYDNQQTDGAGDDRTIVEGEFEFKQDITK